MEGPDHKASLSIDKLSIFIKNLNLIRKSYLKKKRLLTNLEKQTKNKARKTLFFNKNLSEHSILRPDDIIALRSLWEFLHFIIKKFYCRLKKCKKC